MSLVARPRPPSARSDTRIKEKRADSRPDIAGTMSDSYTLVAADESNAIKVRVSFTNDGGDEESLTVGSISGFRGF